jgi:hypothetical protein
MADNSSLPQKSGASVLVGPPVWVPMAGNLSRHALYFGAKNQSIFAKLRSGIKKDPSSRRTRFRVALLSCRYYDKSITNTRGESIR